MSIVFYMVSGISKQESIANLVHDVKTDSSYSGMICWNIKYRPFWWHLPFYPRHLKKSWFPIGLIGLHRMQWFISIPRSGLEQPSMAENYSRSLDYITHIIFPAPLGVKIHPYFAVAFLLVLAAVVLMTRPTVDDLPAGLTSTVLPAGSHCYCGGSLVDPPW